MLKLLEFRVGTSFKLVYKASVDGFGAREFHKKCNEIKGTLIVIKSENGNVFGGYTKCNWHGKDEHRSDGQAFIFSLINQLSTPIKIKCSNVDHAMYCHPDYGPTFGKLWSCDLYISDYSNSNNMSHSDLGINYEHPMYSWNTNDAQSLLAGSYYFQTLEIEVYQIN